MFQRYFPQGIAEGDSFLGRADESARLADNLKHGRHTLLMSPRRYGKTSLARHEIKKINYLYAEIDLFLAIDQRSIETRFLAGIEALIPNVFAPHEQWIHALANFFKKAEKKWTVGFKGLHLELKPESQQDIAGNILLAFEALDHVLAKKKCRAVIFIDEFQEISKIPEGKAIEGAIRHFAQQTKHVVFIFSGSNRHLLADIFGNRSRPLYTLCDWINLSRLKPYLYQEYLNKIAKKTWGFPLPENVFNLIINKTECHPESVYILCANLWQHCSQGKKLPTIKDVDYAWSQHVKEHFKQTRMVLSTYSAGQIKILILIAKEHNKELTGKIVQKKVDLASSSIVAALNVLEREDMIEKLENGTYRIIEPIIKSTLIEYYQDYSLENPS